MWLSNWNLGKKSPFSQVEVVYTTSCNLGGNGNMLHAQVCVFFFSTDLHDMSENAWKSAGRTDFMVILHWQNGIYDNSGKVGVSDRS
jgi:hypothetical protein